MGAARWGRREAIRKSVALVMLVAAAANVFLGTAHDAVPLLLSARSR